MSLLLCTMTVLCGIVACTKDGDTIYVADPNEESASTAPLVTVIYDANALGDRSYNDLIYKGVEQTAQELGLRTMQLSPQSTAEGLQYLELMMSQMEAAQDTVRRLFIVASPGYDDYLRRNSHRLEVNTYADLLYLETQEPLPGKGSTLYLPYYGAMFEAGAMMPALSPRVMLVGANRNTPSVSDAIRGFSDGFNSKMTTYWDPRITPNLNTTYLDPTGDAGFSVADTTALRLIRGWDDAGFSTIVPICGGAFSTFWRMNEIGLNGLSIVGIDTVYHVRGSHLSVVKHIDRAIAHCIRQWHSDGTMPKHQSLGLAEGYTEVVRTYEDFTDNYDAETLEQLSEEKLKEIHEEAIRREEAYEAFD